MVSLTNALNILLACYSRVVQNFHFHERMLRGRGSRHRRTGQHPFGGGQTEFCPNGFSGGGVVAEIFRDRYSVGGGVVAEIFRDPYYVGWLNFFR